MFFKKNYTFKLVRFNRKKTSELKIPKFLFHFLIFPLIFLFCFLIFFSIKSITLNSKLYTLKKDNQIKLSQIKLYTEFYKKYFVNYELINFYLANNFLLLTPNQIDNPRKPLGIGGDSHSQPNYNLNEIKKNKILEKELQYNKLSFKDINSKIFEKNINIPQSLDLIKKINTSIIIANNNNLLESIPFLSPISKKKIENIENQDQSVSIYLKEKSNILASAQGKVVEIILDRNYSSLNQVVISHQFGIKTIYFGIKTILVKQEQDVYKGMIIGYNDKKSKIIYQIKVGGSYLKPIDYMITSQ